MAENEDGAKSNAETAAKAKEVGKPSAKAKTPAGPSKGLDTKDETAQKFVASGQDARASVKGFDAPDADTLRETQKADETKNAAEDRENLIAGNSNHNSAAGVNPLKVAQIDRPDYNPQRRPSSRANQMSSLAESPEVMAARVNAKKEAPTNAEIVEDRRERSNDEREQPLTGYQSPYMGEN